ncbi:MAG: ABC transporter permease, partial [Chloroflexota bacterium]
MKNNRWVNLGFQLAALALALFFTTLILLAADAPPLEAYKNIILGSVSTFKKFSDVLVAWVPLLLASSGLLITFSAGLWNIGMEGQIMMGAVGATWVLRLLQDSAVPPALAIVLAVIAGMIAGALWASLAGALKTFGGVNEIFGGLGLNFVATAFTLWLIFGPWKRPGVGSMSGTEPFPETLWLPMLPESRLSLWALGLAIAAIVFVYFL